MSYSPASVQFDQYGNPILTVSGTDGIRLGVDTNLKGIEDPGNSTTATLGSNAVFTGAAFDTIGYPTLVLSVMADEDSAPGGLSFQWSPDGTNWDVVSDTTVVADEGRGITFNHRGRFFRLVYTNGTAAQSAFRLSVIHRQASDGAVSRPLGEVGLDDSTFAQVTRSIIAAKKPNDTFVNVSASNNGNLKVAVQEFDDAAVLTQLPEELTVSGNLKVSVSEFATSVPLPTGASTEATLAAIKAKTDNLDVALSTRAITGLTDAQLRATPVTVSGTFYPATQPISATSLPLPTGAATESTLSALNTKIPSSPAAEHTTAGSPSSARLSDGSAFYDAAKTGQLPSALVGGRLSVDGSGVTQPISASSLPLPTGAATETTLASINTKTPAVGQATMAASSPVVIASNQTVIPVSDNAGSLTVDSPQLPASLVGSRLDINNGAWLGSTAPTVGQKTMANSIPVTVSSDQSALAITASSLPLPTGAATETTLAAINTKIPSSPAAEHTTAASPSSARLSDGAAFYKATTPSDTQPISAASLPLPAGAATSAAQGTGNVSLASIDAKTLGAGQAAMLSSSPVVIAYDQSAIPVSGTFYPATQPVSAVSLPLPTGAATETTLAGIKTGTDKIPASPSVDRTTAAAPNAARLSDGSAFYKATTPSDTQPVSAASLPLPTGAATSAKQPSLGTAGTPSADVITVQGVSSMTALKVDGSAVTQPISGTVTSNIGTTNGLALDATLTGGTQKAINRGAAKGTTTAADVTSTNQSADRQALDVQIRTSTGAAVDSFGGGTQYADGAARGTATGTLLMGDDGTNIQSVQVTTAGVLKTDGSAVTQPVSASSLPLPTGAATSAKQPALGTAGTPAADVISVQGITSMTALKVDGSAVTQPVSGAVTANIGTTNGVALDATLTGGTQKAIARGAAKGSTTAADVTSTNQSADRQALDVQIRTSAGVAVDTFGGGTQYADGAARGTATGTLLMGDDGTNIQAVQVTAAGILKVDGSAATQPVSAASLPLPTGASTETTLGTRLADSTFTGRINTQGQKTMAASTPVVLASDQSSVPVSFSSTDTTANGTLNALNATASISLVDKSSVGMQLAAGTLIGTIVPEVSFDGGTTWVSTFFDDPSTGNKASSVVFSSSNAATARTIVGAGGASNARVRVSAFTSGSAVANLRASDVRDPSMLASGPDAGLDPPHTMQVGGTDGTNLRALLTDASGRLVTSSVDGQKATYSASIVGLVAANTATDIFTIFGSATKTIRVTRLTLTGTQTTATQNNFLVIKRSTANTAGTSTTPAAVPHDSTNPAATAVVRAYTANPTLGTTVGTIIARKVYIGTATGNSDEFISEFGTRNCQAVVLRGTGECLSVNLNSVTVTGNNLNIRIEWTEE